MIVEIIKGVFVLSLAKKKLDKTLISANAGTPYPKYFSAAAVNSVSSLENEPYPNRPLIISSEAITKPKLAGIENNNESSNELF